MSKRDGALATQYYCLVKRSEFGITLCMASVFGRGKVRGRPMYSACLMDKNMDFKHVNYISFRRAKQLCKEHVNENHRDPSV